MGFMIILTMFSRNYIGVHTPQDVCVGAALGLFVVFAGARLWEWLEADSKRDYIIPCAGIILTVLFLVYISLKSYPMDYAADGKLLVDPAKMMKDGYKDAGRLLGVTLGLFLEKRFVKFSMDVSLQKKVARCAVGVLLIIFYEKAFMPIISDLVSLSWIGMVLTFAELILFIVIYPLCFSKAEELGKSGKKAKLQANKA